MSISVRADPEAQRFEAVDESGSVVGFAEYRDRGGDRFLFHTEVDDASEGKGVGGELARQALDRSLADGHRLVVTCPFVTSWIERHPEYGDKVTVR